MKNFSFLSEKIDEIRRTIEVRNDFAEEVPDKCPLCDGYGNIIDEKGARLCICVRKRSLENEIASARIPSQFIESTLDNFEIPSTRLASAQQKALNYIKNYSSQNNKGLFIYGPTGVGKTHLAAGILRSLIEKGFDGVFYNIVDLLDTIKATYDPNNSYSDKNRLEMELNRQIFVLDDFGVQKTSSWVSDRLYALINRRYQDCKTLLITSNIKMVNLGTQVDTRLFSRIVSMCDEIEISGDDYRQRHVPGNYGNKREHQPTRHKSK